LPSIETAYLEALTDDTGIFQHAKFCIPKRSEGYTTDDNARALVIAAKIHHLNKNPTMQHLAQIYLAFLNHMQKPEGNFHNYLSYERTYLDIDGSEDSLGRTLWGCGVTVNSDLSEDMRLVARDIFDRGLPWALKSTSIRCHASALIGLEQYYKTVPDETLKSAAKILGTHIVQYFRDQVKDDWRWFEPCLTYDNARLPQALFVAYALVGDKEFLDVAVEAMDFLQKTLFVNDVFVPIGNDGWYKRNGNRALYDQQPLEATAMVDAAIDGFYVTNNQCYLDVANLAFEWFLGRNSRSLMVYNPKTKGCCDGISPSNINRNQGAESTVSYLLARLKLEEQKMGRGSLGRKEIRQQQLTAT